MPSCSLSPNPHPTTAVTAPPPDSIDDSSSAMTEGEEWLFVCFVPFARKMFFVLVLFLNESVSIHSDDEPPAAAAHSPPARLIANTNSPPDQMEAAVIQTLSSAPVLCKKKKRKLQCTHTHTHMAALLNRPVVFYQTIPTFSSCNYFHIRSGCVLRDFLSPRALKSAAFVVRQRQTEGSFTVSGGFCE